MRPYAFNLSSSNKSQQNIVTLNSEKTTQINWIVIFVNLWYKQLIESKQLQTMACLQNSEIFWVWSIEASASLLLLLKAENSSTQQQRKWQIPLDYFSSYDYVCWFNIIFKMKLLCLWYLFHSLIKKNDKDQEHNTHSLKASLNTKQ